MTVALARARASAWPVVAPLAVSRALWLAVFLALTAIQLNGGPSLGGVRSALVHWDAIAYLDIAASGYPPRLDYLDAFLPGFPLLVRGVSYIARDLVLSAWLVTLVAEAVALSFIYRLVQQERERTSARFSVWLVALAPTALFFTAPFTESPYIAATAAALFYARRGRDGAALAAATVAACFRFTALALLPALLLERVRRERRLSARHASVLIILLPLAAYCAYMYARTGDALAIGHAEQLPSFGQSPAPPWQGLAATWNTLTTAVDGETRSVFAREVAFGLLGAVLCAAMWLRRRIPRSFALYCTIAWLMTASVSFWRSEARYVLALFPAVLLVADLTRRLPMMRAATVVASAVLMCAGAWIYAQGRWLG